MKAATAGASWCILRCSGRNTLRLASSLNADGIEAWTPEERLTHRVARRNSRRSLTMPVMPGYVFARASHVLELLGLARRLERGEGNGPGRPNHHRFSVWLSDNRVWTISDRDMQALREYEARAQRRAAEEARRALARQKAKPFVRGSTVKLKDGQHGAFEGMIGKVLESDAGNTIIQFLGWRHDVTIRTSLLDLDEVGA